MAIFRTGKDRIEGWDIGLPDYEGNQRDFWDEGQKIISVTKNRVILDGGDENSKLIVDGSFVFSGNLAGLTITEAVDSGSISGTISSLHWGFEGSNLGTIAIFTKINGSIRELIEALETDDFMWLFRGNDEIFGNDFPQLGADMVHPDFPRDDVGNSYTGNRLHGFDGNDKIYGGARIDSLWGDRGNDSVWGYEGSDFLFGGVGNDVLYGGLDHDQLNGGMGNDSLYGGLGNDTLYGLSGADRYIFDTSLNASSNLDTVKDFSKNVDKIVLDDDIFTAFTGKQSVTSALLSGTSQYTVVNTTGDLSTSSSFLTYVRANDTLYYDKDGKGGGDIAFAVVELTGTTAPGLSDFLIIA